LQIHPTFEGKIVIADDQVINVQILEGFFETLDLEDAISVCYNGQKAFDICKALIDEAIEELGDLHVGCIKPVALCLLDFQMPVKNGIEVVQAVRQYIKTKGEEYTFLEIEEPTFVFLTAYKTQVFASYLKSQGVQ